MHHGAQAMYGGDFRSVNEQVVAEYLTTGGQLETAFAGGAEPAADLDGRRIRVLKAGKTAFRHSDDLQHSDVTPCA